MCDRNCTWEIGLDQEPGDLRCELRNRWRQKEHNQNLKVRERERSTMKDAETKM